MENVVFLQRQKHNALYMEKTMKTLMAVLTMTLMLTAASCSKYEGPALIEQTPLSMENTTWRYIQIDSVTVSDSVTEEAIKIDKVSYYYIVFGPDNQGKTKSGYFSVMGPGYIKAQDTIIDMKYTYTRPNGVIVIRELDRNTMQMKDEEYPFSVNDTLLTYGSFIFTRQY